MNRDTQNVQDNLNNTTNLNNIRDAEITIPEINRKQEFLELDRLLELSNQSSNSSMSEDTETWKLRKESIMEIIKKNKDKYPNTINFESFNSGYNSWMQWRKDNAYLDIKCNDLWEQVQKQSVVNDVLKENKLNLFNYTEFLAANKPVISAFKQINTNTKLLDQNKALGSAGDITINELITKGLEVIDTPLVQMIRENVDVSVVGGFLTSMIMYKTIVNLYLKSAYDKKLPEVLRNVPTTRAKELALFMLVGAPFVAVWLWTGNKIIGGKVVVNLITNAELEGTASVIEIEGSKSLSKSSFFLFLNKIPSWLKIILKYFAMYFIGLFIVKVFGYNSNILTEISSQFSVYLIWFLKLYCILNFLVLIYFIWKLYIIVMFSQNKEYLNLEAYPKFIKNELIESKEIATNIYIQYPGIILKHYFKLIFLYSSIVFFGLFIIILYTSS
jgi:hypothetical protein